MAEKKGYSVEGFLGTTIHYDNKGHKIGETRPSFFGGSNHYDEKGHKIGTSSFNFFGGETIYDKKHNKVGSTSPGFFGTNYYDASGHHVDQTTPIFGSSTNRSDLSNRYENLYAEHKYYPSFGDDSESHSTDSEFSSADPFQNSTSSQADGISPGMTWILGLALFAFAALLNQLFR